MKLATKRTKTENLFEILAKKAPVGLYIVQDGRFCYTNSAFQSITGYREDELLDRDSLELFIPEDREMVRENVIKMLKGEVTSPCQFRVAHKDGGIRWVVESSCLHPVPWETSNSRLLRRHHRAQEDGGGAQTGGCEMERDL